MNERAPVLGDIAGPVQAEADACMNDDGVVISCSAGGIAPALDAELRKLYANIHSTLAQLKVYGGLSDVTHVYAARRNGVPLAIFLLHVQGRVLRVVNEGITLDARELQRFADYAFSKWSAVRAICFHAVHTPPLALTRPLQQYACTADLVMPLPASAEAYLAGLGRNMRRNIRRYLARLQERCPDLRYTFLDGSMASEPQLRAIIEMNRARIAGKNLDYALDDEVGKVTALTRECGMTGLMTTEGRIIAGGIGYRVGDTYFFKVNAHDPAYDDYSAGILSCYLTICECIARGCRHFNFMWNIYDYKLALGGKPRRLDHVVVYRSRWHQLLQPRLVLANATARLRHHVDGLLEKAADPHQLSPVERGLARVLTLLRAVRRALKRPAA